MGRAGFLASLEGLPGEALAGAGRLVFLGGDAGVGKTTLAGVLAEAAVDECVNHGVLVVDGDGVGFRHELARLAVEQSGSGPNCSAGCPMSTT